MDIHGKVGDSIRVTGKGKVVFAGHKGGLGGCVIVRHNENLQTLYAHLHKVLVKEGQTVENTEVVGLMGNTGRSTGPHLHYEIIFNNKRINPKEYLNVNTKEKSYD